MNSQDLYLHTELCVVDYILQWIHTGKLIHELLSVSDSGDAGIPGID